MVLLKIFDFPTGVWISQKTNLPLLFIDIEIVYSSPYTDKENYVENINDMQEIFYYFKSEVLDLISDDEVIEILEKTYEDKKGEIFQIQGAIDDFAKEFKLTGGL